MNVTTKKKWKNVLDDDLVWFQMAWSWYMFEFPVV